MSAHKTTDTIIPLFDYASYGTFGDTHEVAPEEIIREVTTVLLRVFGADPEFSSLIQVGKFSEFMEAQLLGASHSGAIVTARDKSDGSIKGFGLLVTPEGTRAVIEMLDQIKYPEEIEAIRTTNLGSFPASPAEESKMRAADVEWGEREAGSNFCSGLAVSPEFRRSGVGSEILKRLKKHSESTGPSGNRLWLHSLKDDWLVRFYAKHDFESHGLYRYRYDLDNRINEKIVMSCSRDGETRESRD